MGITFFVIAGAAILSTTAYVVASRSAIHTALASESTGVGVGDPAAETVAGGCSDPARTEWQLTTLDNLTAAQELLDYLEAQGITQRELVILGNDCFTVRWR